MAFIRPRARILELSTTSGNGPYALGGAVDGSYNTFSAFMSVGDKTYLSVIEPGVAFWTGIATYSAANQITLTTVEESKGTFGNGTKEIFAGSLAASNSMLREDIAGAIVTGGTSTAYTIASFRKYLSLGDLDGGVIAFSPHANNGQAPTLAVDGLAAKPVRTVPGAALGSNVLLQGTPYMAVYNNTDGAFYLHGMGSNTYGVPLGVSLDYWGTTAPSSAFAFPFGQALARAAFPALFSMFGTTYGLGAGGDGTTFGLPDLRGRVVAALDNMGGSAGGRLSATYFGAVSGRDGTGLGDVGGLESHQLTTAQLASHTHANTLSENPHHHTVAGLAFTGPLNIKGASDTNIGGTTNTTSDALTGISINNAAAGGGAAHPNVQPTIVCNVIMRVL